MPDQTLSLQDHFLNSARRAKLPLTVFLVKGVKLHGVITWFDTFSLLLRRDGKAQLVYKHSISTIVLNTPFDDAALPAKAGAKQSLQDVFLSAATRERTPMAVFLVNGVMLQGTVVAFDQFSMLLEREDQAQLIYKHAVSTLQPETTLALGGENDLDDHMEDMP